MLYPNELQAPKVTGRGRGIRTPDILLPKQARYQTALYPETTNRFTRFGIILGILNYVNPKRIYLSAPSLLL